MHETSLSRHNASPCFDDSIRKKKEEEKEKERKYNPYEYKTKRVRPLAPRCPASE